MNLDNEVARRILRYLLKPVVRFCIQNHLSVQIVNDALKEELVFFSAESIRNSGKKPTVSHISISTGLRRREVTRIYKEGVRLDPPLNLAKRVLTMWEQDKRFLTKAGRPRVLSYSADPASKGEFQQLVESVSTDVHPGSVLRELERSDSVEVTPQGLRLKSALNALNTSVEKGMELLGRDTETLVEAVYENLYRPEESRNVHFRTEFDNIFVKDIPKLRALIRAEAAKFHERIRSLLSKHDADHAVKDGGEAGAKVTVSSVSLTIPTK